MSHKFYGSNPLFLLQYRHMKYTLYLLTMSLLFVGGMIVGNIYLPERSTVRAATVSVPQLDEHNPIFSRTNRENAYRELNILNQALQSCPVVVNEEKDRLVNHIKLWLAVEDFYLKKAILELEMAKNVETNRPTGQFLQAVQNYNIARENAENMAEELFPSRSQLPAVANEVSTATPTDSPSK